MRVVRPVNLYGCTIGDRSFVGPFVEIQRARSSARDCRIQSHSFICDLVTIGDDCFVGHGVMFVNDPFRERRSGRARPRQVGHDDGRQHVSIGSNATILPVSIARRRRRRRRSGRHP